MGVKWEKEMEEGVVLGGQGLLLQGWEVEV